MEELLKLMRYRRYCHEALRDKGITENEAIVLLCVNRGIELRNSIVLATGKDRAHIYRTILSLEEKGYIINSKEPLLITDKAELIIPFLIDILSLESFQEYEKMNIKGKK